MPTGARLSSQKIMAFAATQNPDAARTFYRDVLGLRLIGEDGFALMFDANGTILRVSFVKEVAAAPYTVLGWQVDDIVPTLEELRQAGVRFERYPALPQDTLGIWTAPGGVKVAWFKDPDGNTLSISQH